MEAGTYDPGAGPPPWTPPSKRGADRQGHVIWETPPHPRLQLDLKVATCRRNVLRGFTEKVQAAFPDERLRIARFLSRARSSPPTTPCTRPSRRWRKTWPAVR
ncbi:hypothetical protein DSL92_01530 [Billgrantia gudaonensis]|uniref:Uncharacterized protein n=1 Tax=Billgrantia gudaonensis TaxID=376427 RepID=A0A3S0NXG4_9GAMM|nr:hypothetical protein DSL92_01530 [Halomonas gudaonensis]